MIKRIVSKAMALLVALAFVVPGRAQAPAEPAASLSPPSPPEKTSPNPVPAFVAVFLSTILILFIICRPARKL